ncbi:signal peptidase II [Camelliibacillus cellulosilyticus]|uniref:Lipoprotein signal peptidase n=1 Tax=Camelliibacillus cellulosilyticus TaxID=2174486 RepID=A0ABV9GKT8_9BACL
MIYYVLAIVILGLDQMSKWVIYTTMSVGESIEMIPGFLYITSIRNTGAAWNILNGQMWFFFIVSVVVLVIVIYYMQKVGRKKPLLGIALGLIIGGTLGNFIDRLVRGEVIDFIHVYLGSYSYPVFNLADSSLVVGVILILIYSLLDAKKEKKHGNDGNHHASGGSGGTD